MKTDLDVLMQERSLDALVVSGHRTGNPALGYLLNGARVGTVILVKKRDQTPVLIAWPSEREEAQAAGYPVVLQTRYGMPELHKKHSGNALAADTEFYQRIFEDLDVTGRVAFYGAADQGRAYTFLTALAKTLPDIEVIGEYGESVITLARRTKSADEVERIRTVGRHTVAIMEETVTFLQHHPVGGDETLRRTDGAVLRVGDVHAFIRRQIAAHGLEDPEGFIFATGRDAGIPHSKGGDSAPLRLGESIVFDIFPCEAGGGYFFDMTRTFCLGYAPDNIARLYEHTQGCIEEVLGHIAAGEKTAGYQTMACAYFHALGHPTIEDAPTTDTGYTHGLGHGIGLNVHESPWFRGSDTLAPGHVFTIEPGLYYPDEGMGCRLEDVIWLDDDGIPHNLTDYPYTLVIPVGKGKPGQREEQK